MKIHFTLLVFSCIKLLLCCGWKQMKDKIPTHKIKRDDSSNLRFLQNGFQPIRIVVDYNNVDNDKKVTSNDKSIVKAVMNNIVNVFASILSVSQLSAPLIIDQCDQSLNINRTISSTGVNADLIIFPYFYHSPDSSYEAFAGTCVQDRISGRALAGIVGWAYSNMQFNLSNWLDYYSKMILHELTHVLVFDESLFPFFINPMTGTLYDMDQMVLTKNINGNEVKILATPSVTKAVQNHFNCPSALGAELENDGGKESAGSHWESRILIGDYMAAETYDEMAFSDISYALFEDSGWYKMNWYSGDLLKNGKNLGCNYLNTKCITNQKTEFSNDFCTSQGIPTCTASRTAKGTCYLNDYTKDLPTNYQYWPNSKLGGQGMADYCPVSIYVDQSNYLFPSNCFSLDPSIINISNREAAGSHSFCLYTNFQNTINTACYQISCSGKVLTITIGSNTIQCPNEGGDVIVPGMSGTVSCPPYSFFCTETILCNNLFDCINKQSLSTHVGKS